MDNTFTLLSGITKLLEAEETLHKALEDCLLQSGMEDGHFLTYQVWKVDGEILLIKEMPD